jgi:ribonuclease-3
MELTPAGEGLRIRLGVRFSDAGLLATALTHSSARHEAGVSADNERLEYLGDAVIAFVVSDTLFRASKAEWSEGHLTRLRAELVREAALAEAARRLGIGEALRLGRGEEQGGGRDKPSVLAGAFEAVVGAIYLDQGLRTAARVVRRDLRVLKTARTAGAQDPDAKTALQELVQSVGMPVPTYVVTAEEGPPHDRVFTVAVEAGGKHAGVGIGRSKKAAEQQAARAALESRR